MTPASLASTEFSRLAGELIRLERCLDRTTLHELAALAHGRGLADLAHALHGAADPDALLAAAELLAANEGGCGCSGDESPAPTQSQLDDAAARLSAEALAPFASNAALRDRLLALGVDVGGDPRRDA